METTGDIALRNDVQPLVDEIAALRAENERLTAELAETRYNLDCANEELGTRLGAVLELTAGRDALLAKVERRNTRQR